MHSLAEAYGPRPSQRLQLQTEWAAYQFDEACLMAGRAAEKAALENRNQFPAGNGHKPGKTRFRSLRGMATKKVKVKNGVW